MNDLLKGTAKFAIGTCVTLCAVTVAASVAAGTNTIIQLKVDTFNWTLCALMGT